MEKGKEVAANEERLKQIKERITDEKIRKSINEKLKYSNKPISK